MTRRFSTGKLPLKYMQALLGRYAITDPRVVAGPGVGEDVAVIDMGEHYLVVKSDPITFATADIGWYAVNVNANDIATAGAVPRWMLATLLLPEEGTTPELVEGIYAQLQEACAELGIQLVGGHTEVTWGLERPIIAGTMLGEVARERLLTTTNARVGDTIVLIKGVPIEGTAIIAREKADLLTECGFDKATLLRAQGYLYDPGISVVAPARIAADFAGTHAMHDPTEGGLATGLHELAHAARAGLVVHEAAIPIYPEGLAVCQALGLDPLGTIASGSLIVAVEADRADLLVAHLKAHGYLSAVIGSLLPPDEGITIERANGQRARLSRFDADEITRIF
ncbi:MAG: hydrogenase expression/formation protein [Chloroflexi bacterium]|nr:hydrogenase expression/formation protein [Chloroflexota bacterium]